MPIDNIAFFNARPGAPSRVKLRNFADNVVLRIDLRPTDVGKFVVFGRVVIQQLDEDPQYATARLTTLDGKTELDRVDVRIGGLLNGCIESISLQATLELGQPNTNPIVDLRCATYDGLAEQATLIVIQVDDLKFAGI